MRSLALGLLMLAGQACQGDVSGTSAAFPAPVPVSVPMPAPAVSPVSMNAAPPPLSTSAKPKAKKPKPQAPATLPPDAQMAPDFSLDNVKTGKPVKLSKFRGKVVLLDFWATWCGPCRMEIPHFIELQSQYKSQGFEMLGVSLDQQGPAVVKPFMDEWKINYTMVIDGGGTVQNTYGGIRSIPTTVLIGKKGDIKDVFVGYRPKEEFETAIKKALSES